jgi:5'-methylthioadenosine phosphorylase
MVTDYDCWHEGHDAVTVDAVVRVMHDNAANARALVRHAVPRIAGNCAIGCDHALDHALITAPEARSPTLMAKLDAITARL